MKSLKLFITGTDTGVGKTVLSLLCMQYFYNSGFTPFYLKPVQTGCLTACDPYSDARFIYQHVPALHGQDPGNSVVYCLKNAKAPLFAAQDEGVEIDWAKIMEEIDAKSTVDSPLIIEGAGGLFVPVTEKLMLIDLIKMTGATPLIAARAGLGTINHTLLTIEALRHRDITPAGIILLDGGREATPRKMIEENSTAIEKISGIKVAGIVGRIDDFSQPHPECYAPLSAVLLNIAQSCSKG